MKKILLAVVFAIGVPAWANGVTSPAPVTPMDRSECLNACEERYTECLGNNGTECDCFNVQTICLRGCGIHRPLNPCFP